MNLPFQVVTGVALTAILTGLPSNAQPLLLPAVAETLLASEAHSEGRVLQSLTLAEALELAEQNSRLLENARLRVDVLQTLQQEAEATLLPRVVLGANLTYERLPAGKFLEGQLSNALSDLRGTVDQILESLPRPPIRPPTDLTLGFLNTSTSRALNSIVSGVGLSSIGPRANLPFSATVAVIYDPDLWGGRTAAVEAAALEVQTGELGVERQREDLRLLIAVEYYNLQEADALVRIAETALDNALAVLADAQALQAGGVISQLDVRRAQVLVANIQQGLEITLTLQKNAQRRLSQRLGLPATVAVVAADPVAVAGDWDLPLAESVTTALANRQELDELRLQQAVNQRQIRIARSITRPQLSLFASYSTLNVLNSPFNPGFVDGYAVGGTVLWELYDGGVTRTRIARTQLNEAILANQLIEAESEVWLQVEVSYNDLHANLRNIETAEANMALAQEVLRQSRLGFNAGVTTQLEVTTAQTNLTDAETNWVRSILNYNRALAALQRAVSLPSD